MKFGRALDRLYLCEEFHKFIYGRNFYVVHKPHTLLTTYSSKNGIPMHTANGLQRRCAMLIIYNFAMEYEPSKTWGYTNGFTRLIPEIADTFVALKMESKFKKKKLCDVVRELTVTLTEL